MITVYRVYTTQADAEAAAVAYRNRYPYEGYGTYARVWQDGGAWLMYASRQHSCD